LTDYFPVQVKEITQPKAIFKLLISSRHLTELLSLLVPNIKLKAIWYQA
jgi:hypothetical protein